MDTDPVLASTTLFNLTLPLFSRAHTRAACRRLVLTQRLSCTRSTIMDEAGHAGIGMNSLTYGCPSASWCNIYSLLGNTHTGCVSSLLRLTQNALSFFFFFLKCSFSCHFSLSLTATLKGKCVTRKQKRRHKLENRISLFIYCN